MPHDDCTIFCEVKSHSSCADAVVISEPHLGGLLEDYIIQVSGRSFCLLGQGPPVCNLLLKYWKYLGPVFPYLRQGLDVVEVVHHP